MSSGQWSCAREFPRFRLSLGAVGFVVGFSVTSFERSTPRGESRLAPGEVGLTGATAVSLQQIDCELLPDRASKAEIDPIADERARANEETALV